MKTPYAKQPAFTIVELLIVIVVIGILATISIIAYNGITQKAKNTAVINAASQSLRMIEAYIAQYGEYPLKSSTSASACITTAADSGCQTDSASDSTVPSNSTFTTNMATIGILPKSVPTEGTRLYGVTYQYNWIYNFNGDSQPARLTYYLFGKNQQCGIPGVMAATATAGVFVSSTAGYTGNEATQDKTACRINIPGPAHS